jgi:hypothetical protein
MNNKTALHTFSIVLVAMLNLAGMNAAQADVKKDTHYNDIGFFDIHV